MTPGKVQFVTTVLVSLQLIFEVTSLQCGGGQSTLGMMLRRHVFKIIKGVSLGQECLQACNCDVRCQSFNYVISRNMCELNNRTKEARPEDFVPDSDRYYFTRERNRVFLGAIPEIPADSCAEIDASEAGRAVSSAFWLKINEKLSAMASETFPVYCDMTSGSQAWTLIARFSNNDTAHWMNDSGYWWYDKTEASGETSDPFNNTDMISPAFWLAKGNEFKITRSDDSQHTPLLQTKSDCLGGQTFRSKVTSYGDFRNGKLWTNAQCLGKCAVQYSGQYDTTEGFKQAKCNGEMQSSNKIGFWCNMGWSSSVMMIGGGGTPCSKAGHGIGLTAAKSRSFLSEKGRPKKDFGNKEWGDLTRAYALNLWIRGQHK